jgi:beige protein homolog 1
LLDVLCVLVALMRNNARTTQEMENIRGYTILAAFLYQRSSLLNGAILDKVLELVGIVPDSRYPLRAAVIANTLAFRHLIMDYEIWRNTAIDVQRQYFSRLCQLLVHNHQASFNVWRLRKMHWLPRMLFVLKDDELHPALLELVMNTITMFLKLSLEEEDLHVCCRLSPTCVGAIDYQNHTDSVLT